jgi:hypothetical protein
MYWTFRSVHMLDAVSGKFISYESVRSQTPGIPDLNEENKIYIFFVELQCVFYSCKIF